MKCYYHRDRDAIGTCKSCGRGLCDECHVALDKGLACRERCEQDVRNLAALTDATLRTIPISEALLRSSPLNK